MSDGKHSITNNADQKTPQQSLMAARLSKLLMNQFSFCHADQNWYLWTGTHWEVDKENATYDKINSILHKSLPKGFSHQYVTGVQKLLTVFLKLPKQENPKLIPFKNCVLSLETGKTLEHHADMGFTWSLPYDYDPSADCPKFKDWLDFALFGDTDKIEVLRAFLNSFITGRSDLERILELIGLAGAGKSTFITIATRLVGKENTTSTDLKKLEESRFETANLFGKKIAIISDSSKYGGPVETLKRLTGNDPVPFEVKNKQKTFDFVFGGMVLLAANEQPRSNDYTSGIGRRAVRIDFKRRVAAKDRDPRLAEKLCKELPGILNWSLALSHDEVTKILLGATAERARKLALVEANPIAAWMNDNLVYDESVDTQIGDAKSGSTMLYGHFLEWCDATHTKPVKLQSFSSTIVDLAQFEGYDVRKETNKTRNNRVLTNVRLREEHEVVEPFLIDEDDFTPDPPPKGGNEKPTPPETSGDSPEAKSPISGNPGDSGDTLYRENKNKQKSKDEQPNVESEKKQSKDVYENTPESPKSPVSKAQVSGAILRNLRKSSESDSSVRLKPDSHDENLEDDFLPSRFSMPPANQIKSLKSCHPSDRTCGNCHFFDISQEGEPEACTQGMRNKPTARHTESCRAGILLVPQ